MTSDISWVGGDPDPGDNVTYDVYFGTSVTPPKVVSEQSTTNYDPGTMSYSTTYYWKIIASDTSDNSSTSPLFHFKTGVQTGGGEEPGAIAFLLLVLALFLLGAARQQAALRAAQDSGKIESLAEARAARGRD